MIYGRGRRLRRRFGGAPDEGSTIMTGLQGQRVARTTPEPIYEQLLREADEGMRHSVLAGQSSQPGAPHQAPQQPDLRR